MKPPRYLPDFQQGYTLLELIIVLSMAMILAFTALPGMTSLRLKIDASLQAGLLFRSVMLARSHAVHHLEDTTLCPSNNGRDCLRTGTQHLLVFVDKNNNRSWEREEALVHHELLSLSENQLLLRVSRGADYMRFTYSGFAKEFGSLRYCPENLDPHFARAIIINRAGRPYFSLDRNENGVQEDAAGEDLVCDT
jgi:type IV fimbrial biogenesis protein FimT